MAPDGLKHANSKTDFHIEMPSNGGKKCWICTKSPCCWTKFLSLHLFVVHMRKQHELLLSADVAPRPYPWLSSWEKKKNQADPRLAKHDGTSSRNARESKHERWVRLRTTVQSRWRQSKAKKKSELRQLLGNRHPKPEGPKAPILARIVKRVCLDDWTDLLLAPTWKSLMEFLEECHGNLQVADLCEDLKKLGEEAPHDKKLQQLIVDSLAVQAIFPRAGLDEHVADEVGLLDCRLYMMLDTIKFLKMKKEAQEGTTSETEAVEGNNSKVPIAFKAVLDIYNNWKESRKHESIAIESTNVWEDFMKRGATEDEAWIEGGFADPVCDTSDESDYEPIEESWGKRESLSRRSEARSGGAE